MLSLSVSFYLISRNIFGGQRGSHQREEHTEVSFSSYVVTLTGPLITFLLSVTQNRQDLGVTPHGSSGRGFQGSLLLCRREFWLLTWRSRKALGSADAVEQGWWGALGVTSWWRAQAEFPAWLLWHPSPRRSFNPL